LPERQLRRKGHAEASEFQIGAKGERVGFMASAESSPTYNTIVGATDQTIAQPLFLSPKKVSARLSESGHKQGSVLLVLHRSRGKLSVNQIQAAPQLRLRTPLFGRCHLAASVSTRRSEPAMAVVVL